MAMIWASDPETRFYEALCVCGHMRKIHEPDGDFDGERWRGIWGECIDPLCKCEGYENDE